MKTLQEYIEESLLDNFDDLEKDSDEIVSKINTIGYKWKVTYISDDYLVSKADPSVLNKYNQVWNSDDFNVSRKNSMHFISPNAAELKLINVLLSLDKNAFNEDDNKELKKGNCLYDFFQDILNHHLKNRFYKKVIVIVSKSKYSPGYLYIDVYIKGGSKLQIHLKKK